MKALLILSIVLFSCVTSAHDDWTTGNTILELAGGSLVLADWSQTAWAQRHGGNERNLLLGAHPPSNTMAVYFPATIFAHAVISYVLPRGWREAWQGIYIGLESNAVISNAEAGIKFQWP